MPLCALRKLVFAIAMMGTLPGVTVPASMALSAERPLKPQIISNVSDSNDEAAAFSSDGRYLLKGGARGGVSLWEVVTGHLVRSFIAKSSDDRKYIYGSGYSPALDVVIANDRDFVISIWKASTGQLLRTIDGSPSDLNDHFVFAPDGKRMFYAQRHGDFIEIWDTARWKVLRTVKFSAGDIAFSSDGRFALVHSDISSALIDVSLGRELWHGNPGSLGAIAFSSDGSRIAAAGTATDVGTIIIIDVQTGRRLAAFNPKGTLSDIKSLAYSHDGAQIIAVGPDGSIGVLDSRSGQVVRKPGVAWGDTPDDIALSPGGDWLVTKTGNAPQKIWETQTGATGPALGLDIGATRFIRFPAASGAQSGSANIILTANFPGASGVMHRWDLATGHLLANQKLVNFSWDGNRVPVALSPDGRLLATGTGSADDQQSEGSSVALWDASTGVAIGALGKKTPNETAVAISPDGKLLLSSEATDPGNSGAATLWNIAERKRLWSTTIAGGGGAAAFSRDSRYVLVGGLVAKLLDAASGTLLTDFKQEEPYGITSFAFSPDGGRLVLGNGNWDANSEIWDTGSGKLLHALTGHAKYVSSVAFSPDGSRVLTGGSDGTARIWDAATGRQMRLVRLDSGSPVSYVTFTPDGARLITGHWDGAVAVWDAASGALIVTLIASADGEWVAITPDGFFDASSNGAKLLHVVSGVETVSIDQVFQNLFRPDLVREKLAGDPRGLVRTAAANLDLNRVIASGSAPAVRVTVTGRVLNTTTNAISAEAEMTNRGGGIGRIEWRVNGVTKGVDNPAQPAPGQPLRLARSLSLGSGNNEITVVAYNRANLIASTPSPAAAPTTTTGGGKPRLFALIAGVNAYADPRLQLEYAVADATEVARGLREASGNLYQSIDVKVMTDAEVTRDKLDAAFKDIAAKAQPSDVFVLYLAGHGKTVNGRYYFAPQDLRINGELIEKIVNPAVVDGGISQDLLQQWFAAVPADRSLILLDTCESGTFASDLAETKRLEHGAASERIARATGRSIIAATSSSEAAFEAKQRGHGLFTYEMLDGFGNADGDGNGTIELTELAAYVYARVSDESENQFRQRQTPQVKITANFALVKATRVLVNTVGPMAEAKPTYQLARAAQLQVQPGLGATVVRSLSAMTPVAVLEISNGWALLASGGKPIGYVASQDLQPVK